MDNRTPHSAAIALGRREFLAAGAAALAAPYAMCAAEGAKEERWRMRLSTSSIHFRDLPIEDVCARIASLGFEGIDIWSAHENCPHLDDVLARVGPEGLKALLKKHNLKLFAFSVYAGGYARYAELLGKAGGGVAIQGSAGPCAPAELTARMRAFQEGLKPLLELAEKHDSYLAIENHGSALLDSLDSFKAFADNNRSRRLGIALAPYHLQAIKAPVEEAIRIAGSQLFFFYAWQQQPDVKQLPGHGPTDFTPWIAALAKARYRGFVNPFMHGHPAPDVMAAALAASRDYLKKCYADAVGG